MVPRRRVLVIVRVMHAGGGATLNVWSLIKNIASHTDWEAALLSAPKAGAYPLDLTPVDGVEVRMLKTRRNPLIDAFSDCWPIGFSATFREMVSEVDLVHFHSLWRYPTRIGCPILRREGMPHVIAPRGTLHSWAMRHRGFRKRGAFSLYERKNLKHADCLHATAAAEVVQLRKRGFMGPVAVLPNGLSLEALEAFQERRDRRNRPDGFKRKLLFVSRIHPVKRTKELVEAWVSVFKEFPDWELEIVGSGDVRYEREVREPLRGSPAAERTIFRGYLSGKALWDTYQAADLFVLPSHTENFGSVVIEALAAGLPVITTTGTPWAELEKKQCGWWRDLSQERLTSILREAMMLDDRRRREMGEAGRTWVLEEFSWPLIARRTVAVYDWILDGCKRDEAPECVDFASD